MKRIKFKKYAGLKIVGKVAQQPVNFESSHLDRASWLTAEVESGGKFGTVMNFDGTGMTAGLHQAIAVYPRYLDDEKINNDQGPLWKLLNRMRLLAYDSITLLRIFDRLYDFGWYLAEDATLRYTGNGDIVDGKGIRDRLTGSRDGVMPLKGNDRAIAEEVIKLFHEAFSDHKTFEAQIAFGKEHFIKRAERTNLRFCKKTTHKRYRIMDVLYDPEFHMTHPESLPWDCKEMDLADAMFWSNTVNAPGAALKVLCKVVDAGGRPKDFYTVRKFAKELIHALGTSSYGRWDDDIKNGRYQRTRKAAMQVWPKEFFTGPSAIMPKDLEG